MKIKMAIGLIVAVGLVRLLPHPMHFTPLGAMSMFTAAYFYREPLLLLTPLLTLFLTDLFYNNVIYAQYFQGFTWITSWTLYAVMVLMMLVSWLILHRGITIVRVVASSLTISVIFYVVSNFWVWHASTMYPKTFAGLTMCYAAGIYPFFVNTILSDLFYSAVLFGTYEWAKRHIPATAMVK